MFGRHRICYEELQRHSPYWLKAFFRLKEHDTSKTVNGLATDHFQQCCVYLNGILNFCFQMGFIGADLT